MVGKKGVGLIQHGFGHVLQELSGRLFVSRCNELSGRDPGRPVASHKERKLAPGGLNPGNVDVEEACGAALERLPPGLVPLDIRQARDAMPMQTPMQR